MVFFICRETTANENHQSARADEICPKGWAFSLIVTCPASPACPVECEAYSSGVGPEDRTGALRFIIQ